MNRLKQQLFGTDGIRGPVGKTPFTSQELIQLGRAIGQWIIEQYGTDAHILMAQDTRVSGNWIGATLSAGLLLAPITVQHAGVLPTPALCRIVAQKESLQSGIMISASHNPYQDNGIKIIAPIGSKISDEGETRIEEIFHSLAPISYQVFGTHRYFSTALQEYIGQVTTFFQHLNLQGKTILLDCAHGATYRAAPHIFRSLGATVILQNAHPNGRNINKLCGSVYPTSLQQEVIKNGATFGFAFDGDGDRVIAVNNRGAIKNGDDLLALLSMHPRYRNEPTIVGTIMSNVAFETFLQQQQKSLLRTAVGDRWVAAAMNNEQLLLGGEQSGHIILNDYLPTGDGIVTALRVLEAVIETDNEQMETFTPFPQLLTNIPVKRKKDLKEPLVAAIIAEYEQQLINGRLSVRYSGTENVLRIMVEAEHEDTVQQISAHLAQQLKKEL